jgi:uncharacterized protein (DUF1778 family)
MVQSPSTARLDLRTTPHAKALIEDAAAICGQNVSAFIEATMIAKAQDVLAQYEMRTLSDRDRDIFLALLEEPAAPNAALRAASADLKKAVTDRSLTL